MTPQPHAHHQAQDASPAHAFRSAAAHAPDDGRPSRRGSGAVARLPVSETAVSQADGEA